MRNYWPMYQRSLKFQHFFSLLLLLPVVLCGLPSCQSERDTWGQEFIPEGEKLGVRECVLTNFSTFTDTIATVSYPRFVQAPLGEIYDPIFGRRRAYFLTQLVPDKLKLPNYEVGKTELDSAFFSFRVESPYQKEPLLVKISHLEKPILATDSAHTLPQHRECTTVAEMELVPDAKAWVKIPLDRVQMARHFLDSVNNHLKSFSDWLNFFKGVRIDAVRKTGGDNQGSMFQVNVGDPKTGYFFYWKHKDSVRALHLGVLSTSKRFSSVEHDYRGTTLEKVFAQSPAEQEQLSQAYVGSVGDVRTWVDFTKVYEQWRDSMPVTVLRAELRVPFAQANVPYSDTLLTKLFSVVKLNGEEVAAPDVDKASSVYNGYYNRHNGYFSLNLTYTIQGLLLGQLPAHRIALFGDSRYYGFGRAIIANGHSTPQPMQLVITYTKH